MTKVGQTFELSARGGCFTEDTTVNVALERLVAGILGWLAKCH